MALGRMMWRERPLLQGRGAARRGLTGEGCAAERGLHRCGRPEDGAGSLLLRPVGPTGMPSGVVWRPASMPVTSFLCGACGACEIGA